MRPEYAFGSAGPEQAAMLPVAQSFSLWQPQGVESLQAPGIKVHLEIR